MSHIKADNIALMQIVCNVVERTAVLSALEVAQPNTSTDLQLGAAISTAPSPTFEGHPVICWDTYKGCMRLQFLIPMHIVVPSHTIGGGLRVVPEGSNVFAIEFVDTQTTYPQCDFEVRAISPEGTLSTTRMKVILLPMPTPPGRPFTSPTPHRLTKALSP
ncbi:hypothetical protein SAMN02745121_06984 [Nannocystis exedens]|uniref:Uncharacterized protein n=1 Tax=Nannocystis exedens TaxID=54 RepID=A0A1I2G029_9BACT|nr:hypothetical protein [Nannocystis exedens]PCC74619.1 hypothetical protein NAEX_07716 [Nannocystis exedens]SFF11005.1 hypothetical protein SAMN02745121_06984 [Nannocystis exedens]